jgi:hypothetical protein
MDHDKLFCVNEGHVAHNDFGDEVVVIQFASGNYYSLRNTAAIVWKQLAQTPASPTMLLSLFADSPSTAVEQIAAFLQELSNRGLIVDHIRDVAAGDGISAFQGCHAFQPPRMEAFEDLQDLLVADVIHDTDEQGWPHIATDHAA